MEVIVVEDVGAGPEHGREALAGGGVNLAQKAALLIGALPAVLDRHFATAREPEGSDIERVAEGVLGNVPPGWLLTVRQE